MDEDKSLWKLPDGRGLAVGKTGSLMTKAHTVKAMTFPVDTHRYKSWSIKKAEH